MKTGPRYHVKPRRRREGITDYRKRLALLKSRTTRIVIRKSINNTTIQFVNYNEKGDNIVATATSKELVKKYNWNYSTSTTPAAYLTGLLAGKRAKEQGITECVLDIGRYVPVTGSKVFAGLKGVVDAGINCPHNEEKIPSEERIMGQHLDKNIKNDVNSIKDKIIGGK
jgi:large subunit ribosomal protein L18